jgi:hypothetical protein
MSRKETQMVEQIAKVLEERCGKEVSEEIMAGKGSIGSSRHDNAMWVKGAMDRMDALVAADKRMAVMEECGRNCCAINKGVSVTLKKRRAKCRSLDVFFENEAKKPMQGTKLSRKGNTIHFYYTPRKLGKGMRCYCGLVSALPAQETMSATYCLCSVGFVKSLWEEVLEKPVQVKLISSAISGSDECEFEVRL